MGAIEIEIYFVSGLSSINLNRKWTKNRNVLRPCNNNHTQKCLSACA
jgi:hypothetical protein